MASFLSSFISRDPRSAFAFDFPAEPQAVYDGVNYANTHKKTEPEETASMFWSTASSTTSLRAQTQKLKTMRHPNILTYLDSIEVDNIVYLVTERCQPLTMYISNLEGPVALKEAIVSWGLYQILSCLKFLHEANISHENLRRSIYVTAAGDWKIAGLHCSTSFTSPRADLNQLALVLWEIFNGFRDDMTKPEAPAKIPGKLHDFYKKAATPAAAKQNVGDLLRELRATGGYCKSRYVDTLLFLDEFQLKESGEKNAFFNQLRENLSAFPNDVAKYKILPRLIHSYEYGDAGPNILIPMFKLGGLLSEEEYQRKIVPCLVKLFGSPDRTTRVKLLEKIDEFAPHLTAAVVNEKIYGNLAQGFLDSSPAVRESTVKAMVVLAEKLNSHNLNTDLMKYLAKLQGTDEHGGIRTNTTICLGKIAHHLDPSGRQRILIGAFTRGLKDPFPPARMAAVLALSATQQFYALIEIATKILPALAPLTCDPEKQVRDQSFSAMKGFMEKLEKASENPALIPELEAAVKAGGKGLLGSDKVPQWASWALKSLSGKFYKGPTPPQPGEPGTAGAGPASGATGEKAAAGGALAAPKATPQAKQNSGWDDEDDWKDAEEESKKGEEEDEDDWTDGWNTEKPKTSIGSGISKGTAAGGTRSKPATGKMQLGGVKKPVKKVEDDVDELLGITNTLSFDSSHKISKTSAASSGWDDFDDGFGASESAKRLGSPAASVSSKATDGWDDEGDGWGETEALPPTKPAPKPVLKAPTVSSSSSSTVADKDARRAEIAAKNEARKKELAAKRAAKGAGAMKLASTKTTVPADLDEGGWGNSGW